MSNLSQAGGTKADQDATLQNEVTVFGPTPKRTQRSDPLPGSAP